MSEIPSMSGVAEYEPAPLAVSSDAEADPERGEDEPSAPVRKRRLGQVADRCRDGHDAHAPGREGDDQ